jgi:hypothetical protein
MLCQSCGCHLQFDNSSLADHDVDAGGESETVTIRTMIMSATSPGSNSRSSCSVRIKRPVHDSDQELDSPESYPGPISPTSNAEVYNALEHIIEVASQITSRDLPLCSVCTANIYNEQIKKIQVGFFFAVLIIKLLSRN